MHHATRRRRIRARRLAGAAGLTSLVVTGAAAAAGVTFSPSPLQPKDPAAAKRIARDSAAIDLLNRADKHVRAVRPSCTPRSPFADKTTVTDEAPSAALQQAIGALRRPATAEETAAADELASRGGFHLPAVGLYRRYVRILRAADGRRFTLVTAQGRPAAPRVPAACHGLVAATLRRLSRHVPRDVAARARTFLRQLDRDARQPSPADPEAIFLFERTGKNGAGSGGGGAGVAQLRKTGSFIALGAATHTRLEGLLPDGVASVTFRWPKRVSQGPNYKALTFPSTIEHTVIVRDNVAVVSVKRPIGAGLRPQMTWRDAAGNVIHVVPADGG